MTSKENRNNAYFDTLMRISDDIEPGKQLMPEQNITEFQIQAAKQTEVFKTIMKEGRTLKLGIVGEVKAGKSSFLNAMLFNGDEVLPKAPTPMTAALTKLSYSTEPETRIFFYSQEDWNIIKMKSEEYDAKLKSDYAEYVETENRRAKAQSAKAKHRKSPDIRSIEEYERIVKSKYSTELKACKEITLMVRASGINPSSVLSDEPLVIKTNGKQNMNALQDYVGAKGKYTPLVKYTEIQMDNPLLDGIEVIDTPGLNDPILSRSRVTQKFLIECDAVFLMSYVGQFLTREDISFLTSTLPSEGINYAVIIGSKFDSGILDVPERAASSFEEAYLFCRDSYLQQAKANLSCFNDNSVQKAQIIDLLSKSEIHFISSLMFSAAKHKKEGLPYSAEEAHIINRLHDRFYDFQDDHQTLESFADIDDVKKEAYGKIRSSKTAIIEKKKADLLNSQIGRFLELLTSIQMQVEANRNELMSSDVETLQSKLDSITKKLHNGRIKISSEFDQAIVSVKQAVNRIIIEIAKDSRNHTDIIVETNTSTKYSTTTSGFIIKKHHESTTTTTHHTANVADLQRNISAYQTSSMDIINGRFEAMLDLDAIKKRIKTAVIDLFEVGDESFDENCILLPLNNALQRIVIPSLNLDIEKYYKMIDTKIGGRISSSTVKDDDISLLLKAQSEILESMKTDLKSNVEEQGLNISNMLQKQASCFIDDIVKQIEENTKKIQALLSDKKSSIKCFADYEKTLHRSKKALEELM